MELDTMAMLKRVKEMVCIGVRMSALPSLARRTYGRRRIAILAYHEPTPSLLSSHLAYLARYYAFVALDLVVDALVSGSWDSLPTPGVVVTIDDGKRSNFEYLPLFERYGVKPTAYVCSQLVGTRRRFWFDVHPEHEALKQLSQEQRLHRLKELDGFTPVREYRERTALSAAEVAAMRGPVDIQSHSRFHPVLTTCSVEECHEEIARSRVEVEELTGMHCEHFCFPNGDYTVRELQMVRDAGYRSARTVRTGWTGPRSDPYELKILGVHDRASVNELAADLTGLGFLEGFVRRVRPGNLRGRYRPITL